MITEVNNCRSCGEHDMQFVFSLGNQYVTEYPTPDRESDGILAPLDLMLCRYCSLLQLHHTVERDEMYKEYWYKSGMNQTMKNALQDIVKSAQKYVNLKSGDTAIDIGSNDGTLLSFYPDDVKKIGFEPSENIWLESSFNVNFYKSYNDYFTYKGHHAKIITTIAMFYDLDDPNSFVSDIAKSLDSDGIWINQQNYLLTMLQNNTFDNISHEHLEYYSISSMAPLLERHNLEIIDIELNEINGGSFRAYIAHKNQFQISPEAQKRIDRLVQMEVDQELDTVKPYLAFYTRICKARDDTRKYILDQINIGKTFFLYGASTRGQVILQFYGLNKHIIHGAAEKNQDKWGRVTIGTGIPIMSEEKVRGLHPDYMIVLPYSFKDEFIEREQAYLERGGKFVFPLPKFEVIGADSLVKA